RMTSTRDAGHDMPSDADTRGPIARYLGHRPAALRRAAALRVGPALLGLALMGPLLVPAAHAQSPDASDWGYYGADAFGDHFSSLDEINRGNVSHLEVAWTFRTGELGAGFTNAAKLSFEATPILAFGNLYVETPTNIVIALDPET